jgi:hypothetical protein
MSAWLVMSVEEVGERPNWKMFGKGGAEREQLCGYNAALAAAL